MIFWPRLTVEAGAPFDPSKGDPLAFTISNTGFMELRDVEPAVGLCGIGASPIPPCNGPLTTKMSRTNWRVKFFEIDEKYTIRVDASGPQSTDGLFYFPPGQIVSNMEIEISIVVSYQPWILPIRRTKEFRFGTRQERNGTLSWVARPLEE